MTVTFPGGRTAATVATICATLPFPIVEELIDAPKQMYSVVPAGGGGLVGTAQVKDFPAAVAVAPGVTVNRETSVDGAERLNPIAAGCSLVVLIVRSKAAVPPATAEGLPETKPMVTVDFPKTVIVWVWVCPFDVTVSVPCVCAAHAAPVRKATARAKTAGIFMAASVSHTGRHFKLLGEF